MVFKASSVPTPTKLESYRSTWKYIDYSNIGRAHQCVEEPGEVGVHELQILYELGPYPVSSTAPRSYNKDHIVLEADSPGKIALAAQALKVYPCTKESTNGLCRNGTTYSYRVGFSKAVAVMGKRGSQDGAKMLLFQFPFSKSL